MFENFGIALVQLVGFFGVFAFFVYQLLTEKKSKVTSSNKEINLISKSKKKSKVNFFRKKDNSVKEEPLKPKKKGWFN